MNERRAFSQHDPAWAAARLGESALTIGEAGCLLCCLASLLAEWGADTDPGRLNAWLRAAGGFDPAGEVRPAALPRLGARVAARVDYYATPANLRRIGRGLAAGRGALALIDTRPGAVSQAHWVRLVTVAGRDCEIMDPWQAPGAELVGLAPQYGGRGWGASRAIFTYVSLARAGRERRGSGCAEREGAARGEERSQRC